MNEDSWVKVRTGDETENGVDYWISVNDYIPSGAPIAWMYSKSNNEYSVGHFTRQRAGVRVTHWQSLKPPENE